jgi:hypothetical protein
MSEPSGSQTVFIPAQPAILVIGEQRIPIDDWPMARSAEDPRDVEIQRPGEQVLAIEPRKRAATFTITRTLVLLGAGLVPSAAGFFYLAAQWWWVWVPISLLCMGGVLFFIRHSLAQLRYIRFDRSTAQFTVEHRSGFRDTRCVDHIYAISAVRAVQLLYNGRYFDEMTTGNSGEPGSYTCKQYCGYELNLILDDPKQPRLHLFSLSDWEWVRQTGQAIGEFLGVPVIDKLYHGP